MKNVIRLLSFILIFTLASNGQAQSTPSTKGTASEATHTELRQLKDSAVTAINAGNYDQLLSLVHPNIVVTAENGEVIRKVSGVEQFYKKLLSDPNHTLKSFHVESINVDELSILYGDNVAIAFGSGIFDYEFTNGSRFQLPSRWTAVLVRENNKWLLAAFHNSVNLVDNPVLGMARNRAYWMSGGMLLLGMIIGILLGRKIARN